MERQAFDNVWDAIEDTPDAAANMTMRSDLLIALRNAVEGWGLTQAEAARRLGVTQPRLNDVLRGRISNFSLDALISLGREGRPFPAPRDRRRRLTGNASGRALARPPAFMSSVSIAPDHGRARGGRALVARLLVGGPERDHAGEGFLPRQFPALGAVDIGRPQHQARDAPAQQPDGPWGGASGGRRHINRRRRGRLLDGKGRCGEGGCKGQG